MEKNRQGEVREYWQSKEREIGEPILLKSISHTYHSGGLESFWVLFASASYLVFEYSTSTRRSIMEVLFSRREESLSEQLKVPREAIRAAAIVPVSAGRKWISRSEPPAAVREHLERGRFSSLARMLGGSAVCLCTGEAYLLLDTPINRDWLGLLRSQK
jgi:hypothetical protein